MANEEMQSAGLAPAGQYLSFRLDSEHYGIDIMKVQEIRSFEQPTRMPNAAGYLLGVVDLRGVVVPILDLRLRFGCSSAEITASTVVIVIDLGARVVGVVVDAVSDVVTLEAGMVRAAPAMAGSSESACINGLAQVGERMLILLDIAALLSDAALSQMDAALPRVEQG